MKTIEFLKALRAAYPSTIMDKAFPNNAPDGLDECIGIYLYGGSAHEYVSSGTIKFQFISSAKDRQQAETNANEIIDLLYGNELDNQVIDSTKVLNIKILQLVPMYIGKDDKERYQFSFNTEIQCIKIK